MLVKQQPEGTGLRSVAEGHSWLLVSIYFLSRSTVHRYYSSQTFGIILVFISNLLTECCVR